MTTKPTKTAAKKAPSRGKNAQAGGGKPHPLSAYKPEYCEVAVETLSEGHSLTGLAGRIGVARSTLFKWRHDHPEFDAACVQGVAAATYWWEQRAREAAATGKGNPTMIIFGLKNRAADDWRDRVEHTGADGGPMQTVTKIELVALE